MGIRDIFRPAIERATERATQEARGADLSGFQQHAGASADAALASAAQRSGGASSPGQSTLAKFWDSLRGGGAQQTTTPQTGGSLPLPTAPQTTKPSLPLPPAGSVYDPHEAGNQGLIDLGARMAPGVKSAFGKAKTAFDGAMATLAAAEAPKVDSKIKDPTKIHTIEMPTTGNAKTDKNLEDYRSRYTEQHSQDWIEKYRGQDIDAAMKDLKDQIDKAPSTSSEDLTARAKMIAEYQFLEAVKNYGVSMDYDLKGGYAQVSKMDKQIEDLQRKIRQYDDYMAGNDAMSWNVINDDKRQKAAGMTKEEYEQARADLSALQQYRKELFLEVGNAKNLQIGAIAEQIGARSDLDAHAKKGAMMEGNKRAENAEDTGSLYSRMTEKEQKIYDTLFASSGEKAAEAYFEYLGDTLKARKGKETADWINDFESDTVQTLVAQGYGLLQGVAGAGRGMWATATGKEKKTTAGDFAVGMIREDLGKMNTGANQWDLATGSNFSQALFDAATSTGNMIPMIGAATLAAHLGAPQAAAEMIGAAVMGAGVYGNVRDEMIKMGYNEKSASTYAALNAASEVALEKVLGGFKALGGIAGLPAVETQLKNISNAALRYAATMGTKMIGEGTEEYLQDVIDPLFKNLAFSEDNEFNIISEEGAYSFIVAGLSVFGSVENIRTISDTTRCEATGTYFDAVRKANPELYDTLINDAIENGGKEVKEFAENLKSGEYKDNNGNLGELVLMMAKEGKCKSPQEIIKKTADHLADLKIGPIMSEARSKAQAEWEKIVAENPGSTVLNPVETALAERTGWDAETVKEQGGILTKIVSGIIPTNADIDALDLNNKHVRDIFTEYTGIDLDTATNKSELWLKLQQGAKAAAQTEAYQQALKEANEAFLQQRNEKLQKAGEVFTNARTDQLMKTEFAPKVKEAQQSAAVGTDIQPGRASIFKGKRQPIIPAAKKTSTSETSAATGGTGNVSDTTVVNIGGVEISHDDFVQRYMERNKASRAKAEEAWNKALRTNSALNGGTINEQVRSTDEERVDGVASGGSVSEVAEGRAGSGQSEADTGAAETTRGSTPVDAEGLRTPGKVIAETDYTEEQKAFVQSCLDDGFSSVTMVDGDLLAPNGKKLNAKVDPKTGALTISASNPEYMRRVARHERIHLWLKIKGEDGGPRVEFVRSMLDQIIPKKMLAQLFDAYATVYRDVYAGLDTETFNGRIYEEILCDMYGGLDNYGVKAGAYLDAATKAIDKSGLRESYLSSRPADTQTTSEQVAETTENTTAPPDDDIESKVLQDLGVDDEEDIDVNDMLGEEDYAGEDYTEEDLEGVEFSADFLDEEYYSVANTDEEIKEKLLTPETRQALEKNDLTIQDGVVVTNENAELMRTEGYQKPQDWTEQYSVKTEPQWEESFKEQGGDPAVAEAVRRITDWMIANEAVYDYLPHGEYAESKFGPLRSNMEYVFTYDMDASCPRTFQYVYIRDQLQRIAKRPLTFNESINLLNVMKQTNQMIPCTYCYVENKRILKSNNYLNYFAARDGVMSAKDSKEARTKMYSYNPKKGTLGKAAEEVFNQWRQDVAKGEAFHPSADECWDKVMHAQMYIDNWLDGMLQIGKIKKDTPATELMDLVSKKFGITDAAALRETQNFVDQWIYETKADRGHDLAFPNLGAIRKIDQRYLTVHNAAMQYANSASSARSVDNYVPYTDQLKNVSEKDRDFVMGMGGIRKHSSNDFRMDYVQDYLMFFADLANGKWTGHTYTKNVDYVKIFGRTGDRINLSIAFDTKDGRVVMNDQEGANWSEAKELRNAYYDNVGTMAMVTDNLQLSYALNSDWIDMIIPFHASGLPKEVWKNMKAWCDFTSKQNERYYNKTDMIAALKARGISTSKMKASEVADLYYKEFGTKMLYDEKGKRKRPHFFPNDTYIEGPNGEMQLVPGHHNDVETYFRLCEEYGVHPRFYDLMVTNAQGEVVPVTEHPNYLKLIKETARTETEQHPIEFNFDQYDDYLGMSPMDYIMERLQQEAKSGGYDNMKVDPAGIIDLFKKDYLGQDRPIGYISEGAQFKIDAYEGTTAYKEIEANALGLNNVDDLQKLHETPEAQMLHQKMEEMGLTERASEADTQERYSIQTLDDGTQYVKLDGNIFQNEDGTSMSPYEVINKLNGQTIVTADGGEVTFVNRFAGKDMANEVFRKRAAAEPGIDHIAMTETVNQNLPELIQASKVTDPNQPQKHPHRGIQDFDERTVYMADDNNAYKLTMSIANTDDGRKIMYAKRYVSADPGLLAKIKKADHQRKRTVGQPSLTEAKPQSGSIIAEGQSNVNSGLAERASVADEKNRDFNNKQTEIGSNLKTLQGTTIKRYKNNVGKEVGSQVYLHKDYADQVVPQDALAKAEAVLREKHPDFSYNTIMYDKKSGNIRFDEAPDFDTAREPIAGHTVTVTPDGATKTGYSDSIWHHKWLWVGNDYTGFDVGKSWEWSKQWLNTIRPVDVSEHKFNSSFSQKGIANGTGHGTTNWNEQLDYFGLPHDTETTETTTSSEPAVWYSVALDDPVFDSNQRQEPATDDYGGVFYITPTDDSWSVERDSHGNLINTAYLRDQERGLGFEVYDNPADELTTGGRHDRVWKGVTSKGHGTQIKTTKGTYEKIGQQLIAAYGEERAKQLRILDASSGLGFGSQALIDMGFENVTDLEPFPPPDGSYVPNYYKYGDLLGDIQSGAEQPFDVVISNAVINVMAQDARAEIVAALGKFAAPNGHIFINTFGKNNVSAGYQTLSDDVVSTPGNKRASTELQPDTGKTGREAYIKQSNTVQKAFYPSELRGFVRDVLNQTGTDGFGFSSAGGLGINSTWVDLDGRSIKQQGQESTERYSVSENENNQFPEGTLAHEMLDLIRAEGPEGLEKWVNNMLEKNAEQKEQRGTKPLIPPADKQLPVGKVERAIQRGELDKAIEQYGRLRPGEKPSKDIALPKKTGKDSYVRRFFQNAEEAKGVSQRTVEMVERGIITHEDVATYARISDTKANHAADTLLDRFGYNGLMKKWNDEITSVSNRPTKYDIAVGERLLIEADRNGDSATATKIIADLATMGTEAGQVVQAMRLLKKLGPVGQLYYMQRAVDKMNKKYQGRIAKGKMDPIQINQELAQNVLLAETQEDIDKAMKALIKDTANKLPVNLKDKWDAWRYLAMLGNPRTHIRNWLGNDFFRPVRFAKDLLAAAGESIFLKDRSERTKSAAYLLSGGRYSAKYRELNQFAASDFEVMQGDITGTGKMNLTNELLQARDVFKHLKFLNKWSEFNSNLLEKEDAFYLKRAYVNAMAEYMAARGLTAQDLSENTRELNQARQYAALEAQKATYRDFSWLASALNNLKHSNSVTSALLDGVLPFTKTPMNILSRGLEYSPLGLIKGLTIDLAKVQKGDLTAAEAIDHIAGGMTGTMVAVLGAMLANLGIARGSDDDDKKKAEIERAQGHQPYSLEIGGKSFTVDWVAPISLPFFVGVEAYNQITQGEPMDFWDFCDVLTLIAEPMLSLSMLDGLNNTLTSASYADNNALQSIFMSAATSYLSQGLPTFGAQIARTIDPYRRATYIDKNSNTPTWLQQFVQQNQGKIPRLASEKMAYTDIWGRKQSTGAWGLRALENIVFPFYMKNLRTNPVETELLRLSKATGDNSMLPSTLSKSFSIDGESINLTAKQYEKAKSTYGKTSLKLLGDLMGTQAYAAMDDEQKAAAIENALTVSAAVGRKAVKENYAPAAWIQRAIDQDNFEDAVMFHTLQNMETGLTNYQIIECMYWLTPEDQGKLILSQFTPQAKMTDYTQKKYKFELDDSMKARQREIYEEQFWIAYPGLVSSQQWLAADIAGRAELVKELQTALGKQARTIYGDELRRAGVKSVYSDDPQTEAEEIAALINELGYNE